jgi:type II secretory pathway pseudopilin PulG
LRSEQRNSGFSLFELVVFIICVAIIYAAATRRFTNFSGDAERANFFAITAQIQAGMNLEMMMALTRGKAGFLSQYEGSNPMDLLLEPPSNYIGAFDSVDQSSLGRRVWYFDRRNGELIYLANEADGLSNLLNGRRVPVDQVGFKISVEYSFRDPNTGLLVTSVGSEGSSRAQLSRSFDGLFLKPTIPFEWKAGNIEQELSDSLE